MSHWAIEPKVMGIALIPNSVIIGASVFVVTSFRAHLEVG